MPSVREALESAIAGGSQTESAPEPVEQDSRPSFVGTQESVGSRIVESGGTHPNAITPKAERTRDDKGKFTTKEKTETTPPAEKAPPPAKADATAPPASPDAPASAPQEKAETYKPLQSLKPDAREEWAKAPLSIQREFHRIDAEVRKVMQESADSRKMREEIEQHRRPYEAMLASTGYTPAMQIAEHARVMHVLRAGTPQEKAQLAVSIINGGGIDLDLINQQLQGQPAPQQQPQQYGPQNIQALVAQELQARIDAAAQMKQRQDEQSFAEGHEFYADVAQDVQLMRQVARQQGRQLSLEDAYTRAIQMHPEISKILQQRKEAEAAQNANAGTQRARAAASSVRGSPALPTNGKVGTSAREILEAQFKR